MDLLKAIQHSNNKEGYNQVKNLLDNNVNVNHQNNQGRTALMLAAKYSNTISSLDTVKLLLKYGADINIQDNNGWTALMMVTINSNITSSLETVKLLLKYGADVNLQNKSGLTALMLAVAKSIDTSSLETVKLLLDQPNINVNLQGNHHGVTALMYAAAHSSDTSSLETVKLLLDQPIINVNLQGSHQSATALILAVTHSSDTSSLETVKLLLDHANIDVNLQTPNTALMFAVKYSNTTSSLDTVKLLLNYGADPFLKNKIGKAASEFCPNDICKQTIERHIYKNRYSKTFPKLAAQYSANTPIPKQIWDLILLRRDQQRLCQDLSTDKYKGALLALAEILEIPIDESLTKKELYNIISKQLTLGRYFKKENIDLLKTDKMIKELASRYNIDTNQSISRILDELSLVI